MVSSYSVKGKNILVYHGRSHLYEGIDPAIITLPARMAVACGIKAAILTNANGCLQDWQLGDITLIVDHINLSGTSPFKQMYFLLIFAMFGHHNFTILQEIHST